MGDMVLVGKCGLGVVGTIISLGIFRRPTLFRLSTREFTFASLTFLILSRLLVFIAIFFVLGFSVQSDAVSYYYVQAKAALDGFIPYQDFSSSYAPLFPYLASLPVLLWDSPKSIVLFTIFVEFFCFLLWLVIARQTLEEKEVRLASLIYLTNPLSLVNVAINGQNQIWISFLLALSIYFLFLHKYYLSGLVYGFSLVAVKFLSLIFAPILMLVAIRPVRWIMGFAALPVLIYGFLVAVGIDVFASVRAESLDHSSGNIPFLLTGIGLDISVPEVGHFLNGILLIVLAVIALKTVLKKYVSLGKKDVIYLITILMIAFMLISKKSYTNYLSIILFPLCISIASRPLNKTSLLLFGVFSTIATIEPSLWFRWMREQDLSLVWRSVPIGSTPFQVGVFIVCEIFMLSCYAWYFFKTSRLLTSKKTSSNSMDDCY